MPASTETAASSSAKPMAGEEVGEHGVEDALGAILRRPGVFVMLMRRGSGRACHASACGIVRARRSSAGSAFS
ncbi:MAG: hypothetical protein V9G20_30090 [Candidatus Promineifilaceae bacterium]